MLLPCIPFSNLGPFYHSELRFVCSFIIFTLCVCVSVCTCMADMGITAQPILRIRATFRRVSASSVCVGGSNRNAGKCRRTSWSCRISQVQFLGFRLLLRLRHLAPRRTSHTPARLPTGRGWGEQIPSETWDSVRDSRNFHSRADRKSPTGCIQRGSR